MGGIVTATAISGSLDAKNIVLGVLTRAMEVSNLAELCSAVPVPELNATVPVSIPGSVDEDLDEWQYSEMNGGSFAYVNFSLKKDRVKLGVSDEAQFRSRAGDPLAIQRESSAMILANKLDKKVVTALQTSPQTGSASAVWSTVTNNPLKDLAVACAAIRPYKADFVIMPSAVWSALVANDYTKNLLTGNPGAAEQAMGFVPGLGLKIYINENVTAKACLVGAKGPTAAAIGNGPVKVRTIDSERGGTVYQMDVYRQAVAPIMKNDSNLNVGVYKLTSCIA